MRKQLFILLVFVTSVTMLGCRKNTGHMALSLNSDHLPLVAPRFSQSAQEEQQPDSTDTAEVLDSPTDGE